MMIANYLQRLFLGIWIGEMVFFAAVFAPRVFRVLTRQDASKLQNAIFPPYFMLGLICAAVIALTLIFARPTGTKLIVALVCLVLAAGIFAYSRAVYTPKIAALAAIITDPAQAASVTDAMKEEFASLHKASVRTNGVSLFALLGLLGALL